VSSSIGTSAVGGGLVDEITQRGIDTVYIGSHGQYNTMQRVLLGSVAKHAITHAPANVVVVKTPKEVAGTDFPLEREQERETSPEDLHSFTTSPEQLLAEQRRHAYSSQQYQAPPSPPTQAIQGQVPQVKQIQEKNPGSPEKPLYRQNDSALHPTTSYNDYQQRPHSY